MKEDRSKQRRADNWSFSPLAALQTASRGGRALWILSFFECSGPWICAVIVDPSTVSSLASVPNLQCAWCYAEVASPKRCGQCHKRSYCSRECQLRDWKLGHKHWCSISGENGYDFEVREVLGKGRGIFAKKCFERGEVVMMERPLPLAHGRHSKVAELASCQSVLKAVMALMPHGGSLRAKFDLNSMGCSDESGSFVGESRLFVTMAYLNHACLANTLHHFVDAHGVKIISASRRIEQGEEITISYINKESEASTRCELLRKKWEVGVSLRLPCVLESGIHRREVQSHARA